MSNHSNLIMRSKFIAQIRVLVPFLTTKKTNWSKSLSPPTVLLNPLYYSSTALSGSDSFHQKIPQPEIKKKATQQELALKHWGCSEDELSNIFTRQRSLRNLDVTKIQSKLQILSDLGITPNDLVKMINCRPRFLTQKINYPFDELLVYLGNFFGSKELLIRAIVRNPSLLTYDLNNKIKPAIAKFEKLGVPPKDLIPMLLGRPSLITRHHLDDEKMGYIHRTGISKESKMYKYVVTFFSILRIETIQEKVANLEGFGFSEDEVLRFFGCCPYLLTLSVDRVKRNMFFILGTMKLSARIVLSYPFLLYKNLEVLLKPRILIAQKIDDMGLEPQIKGASLIRALRMSEEGFTKRFINCHEKEVADELMDLYTKAKCRKRLAESSKRSLRKAFPF